MEGFLCLLLSEQHSSQPKWFRDTSIISAQVYLQEHSCGIETLWQCFISAIFFAYWEMLIHQHWNWWQGRISSEKHLKGRKKIFEGKQELMEIPYFNSQMKLFSFPSPTFHLEIQYRQEEITEIRWSSSKELKRVVWAEPNWFIVCEPLGFHVIQNSKTTLCPTCPSTSSSHPFSSFPLLLQTCPKFRLLSLRWDSHSMTSIGDKCVFAKWFFMRQPF